MYNPMRDASAKAEAGFAVWQTAKAARPAACPASSSMQMLRCEMENGNETTLKFLPVVVLTLLSVFSLAQTRQPANCT